MLGVWLQHGFAGYSMLQHGFASICVTDRSAVLAVRSDVQLPLRAIPLQSCGCGLLLLRLVHLPLLHEGGGQYCALAMTCTNCRTRYKVKQ